jgi:hypothetical protein
VIWIDGFGWFLDLTCDFAFVFEGFSWNLFSLMRFREGDEVVGAYWGPVSGFSLPPKMTHLSDDRTVAKQQQIPSLRCG